MQTSLPQFGTLYRLKAPKFIPKEQRRVFLNDPEHQQAYGMAARIRDFETAHTNKKRRLALRGAIQVISFKQPTDQEPMLYLATKDTVGKLKTLETHTKEVTGLDEKNPRTQKKMKALIAKAVNLFYPKAQLPDLEKKSR